LDSFKKAENLI